MHSPPSFFRIDKELTEGAEHYVVHGVRPRFTILVDPNYNPEGPPGRGFIKKLRISNGWDNDYLRCRNLLSAAEKYFREEHQRRKQNQLSARFSPDDKSE
ncbi:MAG: hypothetical protein LAT55_05930 [Opitutales bacterium]|nr:hypothetical protein [Opitutales bacterium]